MASISVNTAVDTIVAAGDYNSGTTYNVGDYVYSSSTATDNFTGVWVSAKASNVGNSPASGSSFWTPYNNPAWITSISTLALRYLSTLTHDKFTGSVYATKSGGGAGGKIYIDQSGDGTWAAGTFITNFTKGGDYTVTDGTALGFSEEILLPYVRIRFVYTTNQPTTFRLFSRTADSGVKY